MPISLAELKQSEPRFNFYKLEETNYFYLIFKQPQSDGEPQELELVMNVGYRHEAEKYYLTFKFQGVRQLRLPELGTAWFRLSEVEVEDISDRGMEGLRYQFKDFGEPGMDCLCGEIWLTSITRLLANGHQSSNLLENGDGPPPLPLLASAS
jgi:hypothetical protein